MDDLIYKQVAIDVVNETIAQYIPYLTRETNGIPLEVALAIKRLSSAQPEGRKGVFIPDITVEMFRNASLESVEELMVSGEMKDIVLPSAQPKTGEWSNPIKGTKYCVCNNCGNRNYPTDFCPNCGSYNGGGQDAGA